MAIVADTNQVLFSHLVTQLIEALYTRNDDYLKGGLTDLSKEADLVAILPFLPRNVFVTWSLVALVSTAVTSD